VQGERKGERREWMVREGKRIMKEGGWGKREEESDGERR